MATQRLLRDHALRTHTLLQKQRSRAAALEAELESLQQSLAASTSAEHHALQDLAKSECLHLCTHVLQLPRELRDMIYTHLIPPTQTITRDSFRSTMDPVTRVHSYDPVRWRKKWHPEHSWDTEFVSQPFYEELVQTYYRTTTFVFGDDAGLIARFLATCLFGTDYSPVDLVSRVEIHLSAMTFDRSTCLGYMFGCATKPERLSAALKGAERLKGGAIVVVRFSTQAKDEAQKEEQVETACAALGAVLKELRSAGVGVGLVVDGRNVEVDEECGKEDSGMRKIEDMDTETSEDRMKVRRAIARYM